MRQSIKKQGKKAQIATIIIGIIILAIFIFSVFYLSNIFNKDKNINDTNNDSDFEYIKHFCPSESKNVEVCIQIYQPVCGWFNPDKIQCIKYPCAEIYSNSCHACSDNKVSYYTEGKCPV